VRPRLSARCLAGHRPLPRLMRQQHAHAPARQALGRATLQCLSGAEMSKVPRYGRPAHSETDNFGSSTGSAATNTFRRSSSTPYRIARRNDPDLDLSRLLPHVYQRITELRVHLQPPVELPQRRQERLAVTATPRRDPSSPAASAST
jgi:hypothetical protein